MIESIEIAGWDGIAGGAVTGLVRRTVLQCSDDRCRDAVSAALSFLHVEEGWASQYEPVWKRSRRIGAGLLKSLVPDGQAGIRARMDGREVRLVVDVPRPSRLRGTFDGDVMPGFEIGIDEPAGRVVALSGIPGGPRTMIRRYFICESPRPDLTDGAALDRVVSDTEQGIVLVSEPAVAPVAGVSSGKDAPWNLIRLPLRHGWLRSEAAGTSGLADALREKGPARKAEARG